MGIFLGKDIWWIDGAFGILVSILIIYTAIDIIKEAAEPILGKGPDPQKIKLIQKIGNDFKLSGIHNIQEHNYGSHSEYTMHVHLPKYYIIQSANIVIERFRKELRNRTNIEATIYVEPLLSA